MVAEFGAVSATIVASVDGALKLTVTRHALQLFDHEEPQEYPLIGYHIFF